MSVLNADDPLTLRMARHAGGRVCWFSLRGGDATPGFLLQHIADGGLACVHDPKTDDIIIFATSPAALQAKLDAFHAWCCRALLLVNKRKSWWMPLASMPGLIPTFFMGGEPVLPRDEESYVGMRLCATTRDVYRKHAAIKAAESMARTSAGAVAFSRTGDPQIGEFADAVVLRKFGEVPSLDDILSSGG